MSRLFAAMILLAGLPSYSGAVPERSSVPLLEQVEYPTLLSLPKREANATLAYGQEALQHGKLWLPTLPAGQQQLPLVVFVHGGCWLSAYDMSHANGFASALADAGFAVWSLEYRRHGDAGGGWPNTLEDVLQGIDFVERLNQYPIDLNRVSLIGHSAGGHLVLKAAELNPESRFNLVIGLAAITRISEYARGNNGCQKAAAAFLQTDQQKDKQTDSDHPADLSGNLAKEQVWLLHGEEDGIVPVEQSSFTPYRQGLVAGAGHFDWLHPHSRAFKRLLTLLKEPL